MADLVSLRECREGESTKQTSRQAVPKYLLYYGENTLWSSSSIAPQPFLVKSACTGDDIIPHLKIDVLQAVGLSSLLKK